MKTYLVYQVKEKRVIEKLREEHAFAKAQLLLEQKKTKRVFIRTEGKNLLWVMYQVKQKYLMAGTVIKCKGGKRKKIQVKFA